LNPVFILSKNIVQNLNSLAAFFVVQEQVINTAKCQNVSVIFVGMAVNLKRNQVDLRLSK